MNLEQKKHNLLIVDDEVEITKSIARQFRRTYNIYTATNAIDAIKIMENDHIQVVISDQRMPEITGVDFFNRIKDKYPNALKLILTGYADIEAVIGAIYEGHVFRYITKPWNPTELELTIKEAFDKYELITRNQQLMLNLQETNHNLEEKVNHRTQELKKSNNKLKALNTEKNRYIGIVAHDLRNPIGAAKSFSDLLLEDRENCTEEQQIQYITIIND
jgi:response regulator RpfG family c-di-GMP phosphodiesterase